MLPPAARIVIPRPSRPAATRRPVVTRRPAPVVSVVPFGFPEPSPFDAELLALRRYLAGIGPSPTLLALRAPAARWP
jgi:hypothetical protein